MSSGIRLVLLTPEHTLHLKFFNSSPEKIAFELCENVNLVGLSPKIKHL